MISLILSAFLVCVKPDQFGVTLKDSVPGKTCNQTCEVACLFSWVGQDDNGRASYCSDPSPTKCACTLECTWIDCSKPWNALELKKACGQL